jgi:glycosyltransferase involved in cell wall biosynthesis
VLVPCLNEEQNIAPLTNRLITALTPLSSFEIIFIDDGSQDNTWAEIERAKTERVRGVRKSKNGGIEAAWRDGLQESSGELLCLIDADLQNPPEEIPNLLNLLERTGADIAQGSRQPTKETERSRLLLSRTLNWMLNTAFGMQLDDNKSGFLVLRREVLKNVLNHRLRYRYFQCLIAVAAHSKGYTIAQMPTPFLPRLHGESFMSRFPLRVVMGCLRDIGVGFVEYRLKLPAPSPTTAHHQTRHQQENPNYRQ